MRHIGSSQVGQASVEHVGLVLLLAPVLAALAVVRPEAGVGEAIASAITGAHRAAPAPASAQPEPVPVEIVDRYLAADLAGFLAYRSSPDRDPRLDWSTDLCSAPLVGSSGNSFDFTEACIRHDFGYRNYDHLGGFRERKADVDEVFYADMRDHCATRPPDEDGRCRAWARIFYEAVRHFGHLTGHG